MLRHPITVRKGTTDRATADNILVRDAVRFELANPPRTIVDAGANIGVMSALFLSLWPEARVIAVEPEPSNAALLRRNLEPYGGGAEVLEAALWPRRAPLAICEGQSRGADAYQVAEADGRVASVTPADLIERSGGRIDLLKVDIESAELDLFQAEDRSWLDHVGTLAIELHDWLRPGCAAALAGALDGRPHERTRSGEYDVIRFDPTP